MNWLKTWRGLRVLSSQGAYAQWAQSYQAQAHNPFMVLEQQTMLSLLPDVRGLRVLDLACGTGRWMSLLQERGAAQVLGVDDSSAMLAQMRHTEQAILQATMQNLPFADASFDAVVCGLAVGHLQRIQPALSQMGRVLKQGGFALMSDLHPVQHWRGAQRTFKGVDGRYYAVEHYPHHLSDYLEGAGAAKLSLAAMREPSIAADGAPVLCVTRWTKR